MSEKQSVPEEEFGIGAVVERTGLTAPSIRMWEKRYNVVEPRRSETNRRLYSLADVERLTLLKRLTDRGHSIRTIAQLDTDQLKKRLGDSMQANQSREVLEGVLKPAKIVLVGMGLENFVRDEELFGVQVVGEFGDLDEAKETDILAKADLLVISTESLFPEILPTLRNLVERTGVARVIIVYRFISKKTATVLAKSISGVTLVKAPVTASQIRRECLVQLNEIRGEGYPLRFTDPGPVPDRLYDAEQLIRLARLSSAVECECPQHMASLLQSLCAFEKYSDDCEDRNPEDALLHSYLHRTTAKARRSMEEALRHLILTEGIDFE